jgi:DNA repair protein RecO (recombination protein O)
MLLPVTGIVIRTIKYGETSVITDIYSKEFGLLACVANGVRSPKSTMPFSLFQPMMLVDGVAYIKPHASLHRIKELRLSYNPINIPFHVKKGGVALFMAEVCRKCLQHHENNEDLFRLIREYVIWLDQTPETISNIHLHFLIHLSRFLGFQPEFPAISAENYCLDLQNGRFVSDSTSKNNPGLIKISNVIIQLYHLKLTDCHEFFATQEDRRQTLHTLISYYQLHQPGFTQINTPEILNMVLNNA